MGNVEAHVSSKVTHIFKPQMKRQGFPKPREKILSAARISAFKVFRKNGYVAAKFGPHTREVMWLGPYSLWELGKNPLCS